MQYWVSTIKFIKIFHKHTCARCPAALELGQELQKRGVVVELIDTDTAQGKAEAIWYDVMSLPVIVITTECREELKKWTVSMPHINDVMALL